MKIQLQIYRYSGGSISIRLYSSRSYLFGVVKTLEIVFTEKRAVLGFSATRHTLAEIHPEIITPPFVPCYPPAGRHWFWIWPYDFLLNLKKVDDDDGNLPHHTSVFWWRTYLCFWAIGLGPHTRPQFYIVHYSLSSYWLLPSRDAHKNHFGTRNRFWN